MLQMACMYPSEENNITVLILSIVWAAVVSKFIAHCHLPLNPSLINRVIWK